jgi:transposase
MPCMRGCAASGPGWWSSRYPPTPPELNPVEPLWSSLKGVELANLAGDTLDDVIAAAERGIQRIRHTHHLAFSFLRCCGLSLW